MLRRDAECVCHLSAALDKPQPYISQQLAILRNAGVIVDERAGANVFYRIASADVAHQVATSLNPLSADEPEGRRIVYGCPCPKCQPRAEAEAQAGCNREGAIPALEESRKP